MNKLAKARKAWQEFEPRSNKCPICKKSFRYGCGHSIVKAKARLFENYVEAIVENKENKTKKENKT